MDKPKSKRLAIKIIIPTLIVCVIAAIFIFKNVGEEPMDTQPLASSAQSAPASDDAPTSSVQEDSVVIPLAISEVDLDEILSHNLPVIIDFGADSCIPCKEMAPVLKRLNEELQGIAVIQFVDVWKYTDAADGFPVRVIPTQVFIMPDGSPYVPSEGLGIEFTTYVHKDTGEHLFTTHEGGLNEEQMLAILQDMGAKL